MGLHRYLILTGATGQIGRSLLTDLLRSRIPVAVLARGNRQASAAQRIEQFLTCWEHQHQRRLPRPIVLQADLAQPGLGLSSADRNWLLSHAESVLHSAASVSFRPASQHPEHEPFRTNVEGTRALIELAQAAGVQEFHQISSAYACGLRRGRILETELDPTHGFANDYEQSKLKSEQLLHAAGFASTTIYRPSIVVDLQSGSMPMNDRTVFYAFSVFQLVTQRFGNIPGAELFKLLNLTGKERKNLVSTDWVSRTITDIYRHPECHGRTYHLTNPQGTSAAELLESFQQAAPPPAASSSVPAWSANSWGELNTIVEQFVETLAPYFRDDPVFDQSQLQAALQITGGRPCPALSQKALQAAAREQLRPRPELPLSSASTRWSETIAAGTAVEGIAGQDSGEQAMEETSGRDAGSDHCDRVSPAPLQLTLTGSQGGEWVLCRNSVSGLSIASGQAKNPAGQVYVPAMIWNQLLSRHITLEEALQTGRLLVEADEPDEILQELEAILRRLNGSEAISPDGLIHNAGEALTHGH
jgi:thioester reductase-like protein